jgi:hypothetical protein
MEAPRGHKQNCSRRLTNGWSNAIIPATESLASILVMLSLLLVIHPTVSFVLVQNPSGILLLECLFPLPSLRLKRLVAFYPAICLIDGTRQPD